MAPRVRPRCAHSLGSDASTALAGVPCGNQRDAVALGSATLQCERNGARLFWSASAPDGPSSRCWRSGRSPRACISYPIAGLPSGVHHVPSHSSHCLDREFGFVRAADWRRCDRHCCGVLAALARAPCLSAPGRTTLPCMKTHYGPQVASPLETPLHSQR